MARTETWFDQDLKKPVSVRIMAGVQFSEDNQGSLIGVRVYDDGADATLTGGATGYCILADGQTITVDGTLEGNTAYILLPQSALLVPGPIQITIKIVDDGVITTLLACVGTVIRTKIGVPVVPGSVIEEWSEQISETLQDCVDDCQAAADAMGANLAAAYSSSATYPVGSYVIQSGTLYRCTTAVTTAGSWSTNSSKFTVVKLGNDISDLKSAFETIYPEEKTFSSGYINTSGDVGSEVDLTPTVSTTTTWLYVVAECSEGDAVIVTSSGGSNPRSLCFIDSDNKILYRTGSGGTLTNAVFVAPANTSKVVVNASKNSPHKVCVGYYVKSNLSKITDKSEVMNAEEQGGFWIENVKYEIGTITNGEDSASAQAIRTAGYIEINHLDILKFVSEINTWKLTAFLYDSTKTYLSKFSVNDTNGFDYGDSIYIDPIESTAKYIRFSINTVSNATLDDYKKVYLARKTGYQISISNALNKTVLIGERALNQAYPVKEHAGYVTAKNWFDARADANIHCKYTDIIPTTPGDKFEYTGRSQNNAVGWIFFSGTAYVSSGNSDGSNTVTVTIPDNVDGVKFASYQNQSSIEVELVVKLVESGNTASVEIAHKEEIKAYLHGKKIGLDGDSICWWNNNTRGYAKILHNDYGMVVEDLAESGGTVATGTYFSQDNPRHWICESVPNLSTDNEFIIVEGGVNDVWQDVPLGSLSSGYDATLDKTTFYGALETVAKLLRTKYITKKVGYIIVHKTSADAFNSPDGTFYNAVIAVMGKWGIPVLNLNIIAPPFGKLPNTDPTYAAIRTAYTTNGDGTHPTQDGYRLFYIPHIVSWLYSL